MNANIIDVDNSKKILDCCPYYDDIINYEEVFDEFSFDIIDWYKDVIFSYNGDNKEDIKTVKKLDKGMYMYVNDISYRNGLKKKVNIREIDFNSKRNTLKLINKIINYTENYEKNMILNITSSKWL